MYFLWQHIGKIILICFALYLVWIYAVRKPVYQRLYGNPDPEALVVSLQDTFTSLSSTDVHAVHVSGYDINIQPIKKYNVTGYLAMVDRYSFIGSWFRSATSKHVWLYDAVSPLDLSIVHGARADKKSMDQCRLKHEYRLFSYACPFRGVHYNNHHVIPATYAIEKGLEILTPGRIVQIEGYAVYWQGTGVFKDVLFESAVTSGQMSNKIAGGSVAGLCTQLYLTKLSFDGYVFE